MRYEETMSARARAGHTVTRGADRQEKKWPLLLQETAERASLHRIMEAWDKHRARHQWHTGRWALQAATAWVRHNMLSSVVEEHSVVRVPGEYPMCTPRL
jgi:hypothetical protein